MGLWNIIKRFFNWLIIDDVRWIIQAIKKKQNDEPVFSPEKVEAFKQEMKTYTPRKLLGGFLKYMVPTLIIALFAGSMGWLLTAKYYQIECNNFMIENYIKPMNLVNSSVTISPFVSIFENNEGDEQGQQENKSSQPIMYPQGNGVP